MVYKLRGLQFNGLQVSGITGSWLTRFVAYKLQSHRQEKAFVTKFGTSLVI
jgi:hypothetical protein